MSEEHDHDLSTALPSDTLEELDEYDVQSPVETVMSVAAGDPIRELLPMVGGGALLLSALGSIAKGQLRAIPKGAVAIGLLRYGLRNRRSSGSGTFEPDLEGVESGTDGKEVSDQAHAAAERDDAGHESQIDASGEVQESAQLGEEGETGSRVEFTEDTEGSEPRTKPDNVGDEGDPRRETGDDDEAVEIDVSDTAMAEEVAEATGPDPEQAQPSQTDTIEPEETPEEDASDMKVDPDEDSESASGEDEDDRSTDASEDDENDDDT